MGFKIAYGAGHDLHEAGKRLPKALDPKQTREWELNDRVARHFAEAAGEYEGVELLRTDDPTGENDPGLNARCQKANAFDADFALSIHHNAGANQTNAGGIEAYSYYGSEKGMQYRDAIYESCITYGGLQGNRAVPKKEAGFHVLKYTAMPCVLMEYGFMDSLVDAPIILQDAYSRAVARATMLGIARVANLQKKAETPVKAEPEEYTLEQFIRDVQSNTGSKVDGIAGPETLGNTVSLSAAVNSTHPLVAFVQKRLHALGYSQVGQADGVAGPKFDGAVRAFQQANDCWVDGEITAANKTWRKLLGME